MANKTKRVIHAGGIFPDGTVTVNVKIEGVPENTLPLDYLVNNQAEK